jgi:fatty acid synthase subunit alpha, fungi type
MEVTSETILSGKAKVMVAGGFDDLWEEGSYEFSNMKVTSNSEPGTKLAMGREPMEMSWQMMTTCAGCVLSSLLLNCHSLI